MTLQLASTDTSEAPIAPRTPAPHFDPYANCPMREHSGSAALEWRRGYVPNPWRYMHAMPLEECKG
jgi:hypothetical protein